MKINTSVKLFSLHVKSFVSLQANRWLIGSLLCGILLIQTRQANAQTVVEGLQLIEREQTGKALQVFNQMISSNPKDASLYFYRGYTYIQREKQDSAMADFMQGITVNPKEALNYVGKGYALLNQNKVPEAEASFDQAMSMTKSKNPTILNTIAEAYLNAESKNVLKAKTLLEKSLQLEAGKINNPQTYLLLGDAYILENNGGKSVSNYERATEINKSSAKGFYSIGKVWARGKNYPLSLEGFQKAIAVDPNYAPAYKELGELYYRTNQVVKAEEALTKYMQLSDIKEASRDRYAAFLFLAKKYKQAVDVINEALPKNPNSLMLLRLLGYSSYEIGAYANGLNAMQKYFTVAKPEKILASDYEYRGKNLIAINCDSIGLKDCDSLGILDVRKAIEMDSTKADLRQVIIDSYKKDKRFGDAASEFEKIISKKAAPNATDYFTIGVLYMQSKQFEKADSSFTKVTGLAPTFYQGFLWKGKSEFYIDPEYKKGLSKPSYEKVIELLTAKLDTAGASIDEKERTKIKKDLVEAYSWLASYHYINKKDESTAKEYWNKVLAVDPQNKQAPEAIRSINAPKDTPKAGTAKAGTKPKAKKN
ncbi:MAG: hypothetical protein V4714_03320 [Bacteroidota bacterium]